MSGPLPSLLALVLACCGLGVPGGLVTAGVTAQATVQGSGGLDRDVPVVGHTSYVRAHHDYPATDIWAACGSKVVAPVTGTVLEVRRHDPWKPSTDRGRDRGGRFVSIRGRDHVRYYGSHLSGVAHRLVKGRHVTHGKLIGRVGHSGDARYVGCHLHFGLSPVCRGTGDWWVRRGEVWPYRFLRSWESGGDRSPRHAVRRWRAHHSCAR